MRRRLSQYRHRHRFHSAENRPQRHHLNLTKEERQPLPKICDKTLAFDEKCKAYMAARSELVLSFRDMAELTKDRKAIVDLLPSLCELAPL